MSAEWTYTRSHISVLYFWFTTEENRKDLWESFLGKLFLTSLCLFLLTDAINYTFRHCPLVLDPMQLSLFSPFLLNKHLISCFTGSVSRGKEPQSKREFSVPSRTVDRLG